MKLTIIHLTRLSTQDTLDLNKIWPEYRLAQQTLDETHRIYAARFNDRLLGAVRLTVNGTWGELDSFRIRDVTRRRGVGRYLLEEMIRDNADISDWHMTDAGVENRAAMDAFMQASGFRVQRGGWQK